MENINRIELRGNVGNVRLQKVGDRTVARFTVATSCAYRDSNGCPVVETTWHAVTAWEGKGIKDLDRITRGGGVYVTGRLRNQRYTGSDGVERCQTEVLAGEVELIES